MTGPTADHGGAELSPGVRELVDQVRARAQSAMTLDDVKALSRAAAAASRGKIRTVEEVEELYGLAEARLGEINGLMLELADLTGDQGV